MRVKSFSGEAEGLVRVTLREAPFRGWPVMTLEGMEELMMAGVSPVTPPAPVTAMRSEVAGVSKPSVAERVSAAPAALMVRLSKVATPLMAATLRVPPRVPAPLLRVRVMLEESVVMMLLLASSTAMVTAGESVEPVAAVAGVAVKARWVAAPRVVTL